MAGGGKRGQSAASRRKAAAEKAAAEKAFLEEQWGPSMSSEDSLLQLVQDGVLAPAEMDIWRLPEQGETFPHPADDELVVFEDYFIRGLGYPVHNFLRDLCIFWGISICNLIPNSILTIAIFVTYCEAFLGIPPHFNLFRHLYMLKKKGNGTGGSQIAGGCYLVLREGMKSHWLDIKHATNIKDWMKKWFYIAQNIDGPRVPCNIAQIPQFQPSWSDRPELRDMDQIRDLMSLMNLRNTDGIVVASTFATLRIQPLKERVHPMFEFSGQKDPSREREEPMTEEQLRARYSKLFHNFSQYRFPNPMPPIYRLRNPPPKGREIYISRVPVPGMPVVEQRQVSRQRPLVIGRREEPAAPSPSEEERQRKRRALGKEPVPETSSKRAKTSSLGTGGKLTIGGDEGRAPPLPRVVIGEEEGSESDVEPLSIRRNRRRTAVPAAEPVQGPTPASTTPQAAPVAVPQGPPPPSMSTAASSEQAAAPGPSEPVRQAAPAEPSLAAQPTTTAIEQLQPTGGSSGRRCRGRYYWHVLHSEV